MISCLLFSFQIYLRACRKSVFIWKVDNNIILLRLLSYTRSSVVWIFDNLICSGAKKFYNNTPQYYCCYGRPTDVCHCQPDYCVSPRAPIVTGVFQITTRWYGYDDSRWFQMMSPWWHFQWVFLSNLCTSSNFILPARCRLIGSIPGGWLFALVNGVCVVCLRFNRVHYTDGPLLHSQS